MKILAIRGENLASLAGRFELDLEGPPLGGRGTFLIGGPTGAGKSTLLDALCLALFGRTPRLHGLGRATNVPDPGDSSGVSASSVEQLLRRGAGSGSAEVELLDREGRRLKATWRVKRARGRASGKLQTPEQLAEDVATGEPLGRTKSEVRAAIEQRLGLDFEQFRRAVLLAQNDFAALLHATSDERAALLEALTGTDRFTRLSQRAHERAGAARQQLAALEDKIDAGDVLPGEQRQADEAELAATRQGREAHEAEIGLLEGALARAGARAGAEGVATRAGAALASAREAHEAREGDRALLERRRQIEEARPLAERSALAARGTAGARAARAEAERALASVALELTAASGAREAAEAALGRARDAAEQRAEELTLAEQLDEQVAHGEAALAAAASAAERAHADLERERGALAEEERALAAVDQRAVSRSARVAALEPDLQAKRAERAGLPAALADAQREAGERAREAERAVAAEEALGLAVRELFERLAAREAVSARVEQLTRGEEVGRLRRLELESEERSARERAEEGARRLEAFARATDQVVERLRATLAPGAACPVCGSDTHPWGVEGATSSLREERERLAGALEEARAAASACAERLGRARAEEREAASALSAAEAARKIAEREEQERRERLLGGGAVGEPELAALGGLDEAGRALWIGARLAPRGQRLEEARARAEELAEQARRAAELEAAIARLETELREVRAQVVEDAAALTEATRRREGLVERVRTATERAVALGAEGQRAADHASSLTARRAALLGGRAARDVREELEAALRLAAEQVSRTTEAERVSEALSVERANHLEQRQREVAVAARAEEDAAAALGEWLARAAVAEPPLVAGREELDAELATPASEQDRLRAALAQVEAQLREAERAAAEAAERLERAREAEAAFAAEARARGAESIARCARGAPGELDTGALTTELDAARARRDETLTRHAALEERLRADDRARELRRARGAEAEAARREVERWRELSDLIGSHDGKRLRALAQEVTLDLVLAHANAELSDLAPRYSLERLPASCDLVVVDGDLGDARRSVGTLSGGETFLVSLALALGLASLSSEKVRVETLFIDEGFGSLDQRSLEVAVEALARVEGRGRQVGVISHVGELGQRLDAEYRVTPRGGGRSEASWVRRP